MKGEAIKKTESGYILKIRGCYYVELTLDAIGRCNNCDSKLNPKVGEFFKIPDDIAEYINKNLGGISEQKRDNRRSI